MKSRGAPLCSVRLIRRSPCGERGLKFALAGHGVGREGSLPVRGAWVEMMRARRNTPPAARRSPCGERGLKLGGNNIMPANTESLPVRGAWVEIALWMRCPCRHDVAPRAGSVG